MTDRIEEKFWIVVDTNLPTKITTRHYSEKLAKDEAERLARKEGRAFAVMELLGVVNIGEVPVTWEFANPFPECDQ